MRTERTYYISVGVRLCLCVCLRVCVYHTSIRPVGRCRRMELGLSGTWSFARVRKETKFLVWRWSVVNRRRPAVALPTSRKWNGTRSPTWKVIWSQVTFHSLTTTQHTHTIHPSITNSDRQSIRYNNLLYFSFITTTKSIGNQFERSSLHYNCDNI